MVKRVVFLACLMPLVWLATRFFLIDGLGANPIEAINRFLGDWALRMLLLTLAVTPIRRLTGWGWVGGLRRMLGLYAFFYVSLHISSYLGLDLFFDWAAFGRDLVKRTYITLGMIAFILLIPLAATSTNGMIKRLGGQRWRALHRLVYGIAPLGVAHHWLMVKADLTWPLIHAAILALLLGLRLYWRFPIIRR